MAELTQSKSIEQANLEELTSAIDELQEYRDRLVRETMATAKKAKVVKAHVETNLEPTLTKIDSMLEELRQRLAMLTAQA
ncbi:MAG: hypothetical protein O2890_00035 [Cyanobacteria bacterium]|nr:hypothetical protein [Cyanobacteriota bacterium]MDA0864822.1 hypothetical protein [Cyanobacteriota bacterium]